MYDEVRKGSTGQGDDYTIGCLLDYAYFRDNYKLIAFDLSKQKAWYFDPKAIQQIVFQGTVGGEYKNKTLHYFRRIKRNRILQRNSKSL